jgi:hypothetical protein
VVTELTRVVTGDSVAFNESNHYSATTLAIADAKRSIAGVKSWISDLSRSIASRSAIRP